MKKQNYDQKEVKKIIKRQSTRVGVTKKSHYGSSTPILATTSSTLLQTFIAKCLRYPRMTQ